MFSSRAGLQSFKRINLPDLQATFPLVTPDENSSLPRGDLHRWIELHANHAPVWLNEEPRVRNHDLRYFRPISILRD